ncbi:MAG: carboxypeptidase regulatory-like domain-containing protein [Corallincola sp.]|nr:carboxypeptidase regulatory-like domain-containing protein [Corallincola sp.]
MTPTYLAIISVIVGISPLLIALLGSQLADLLDCEHEGGTVRRCYFCGRDVSSILYGMMMMHWLMLFTPGIAMYGIIASLLWAYVGVNAALVALIAPFGLGLLVAICSYIPLFTGFRAINIQLSPEVSGAVVANGQPLVGATVVRQLEYGRRIQQRVVTDSDGRFSFPAHHIRSFRPGYIAERFKPTLAGHGLFLLQQDDAVTLLSWRSDYRLLSHPLSEIFADLRCDVAREDAIYQITNDIGTLIVSARCELPQPETTSG